MKKIFLIVLCFTLTFFVAGCKADGRGQADTPGARVFQATILEINNDTMLVNPVEGSSELTSADKISLSMKNLKSSTEPQVGDIVEIEYDGEILESYPAQLSKVTSITILE